MVCWFGFLFQFIHETNWSKFQREWQEIAGQCTPSSYERLLGEGSKCSQEIDLDSTYQPKLSETPWENQNVCIKWIRSEIRVHEHAVRTDYKIKRENHSAYRLDMACLRLGHLKVSRLVLSLGKKLKYCTHEKYCAVKTQSRKLYYAEV